MLADGPLWLCKETSAMVVGPLAANNNPDHDMFGDEENDVPVMKSVPRWLVHLLLPLLTKYFQHYRNDTADNIVPAMCLLAPALQDL